MDCQVHIDAALREPSRRIRIPKKDGYRQLTIPSAESREVQRVLLAQLTPWSEGVLQNCCIAYRRGRGVHRAVQAVKQRLLTRSNEWLWQSDVRDFFPSVLHSELVVVLRRLRMPEREIAWVLKAVGAEARSAWSPMSLRTRGLPQGSPLSPLIANLFLTPTDTLIEHHHRSILYLRYADDLLLLGPGRQVAEAARSIELDIESLGLRLHRTRYQPSSAPFRYLGSSFMDGQLLNNR